jgi:hypothetical protein
MASEHTNLSGFDMASQETYQITVKGMLDQHWSDWFNGTLVDMVQKKAGCSHTHLTCRVRDQAELLGILTRLNSLNLPILLVRLVSREFQFAKS